VEGGGRRAEGGGRRAEGGGPTCCSKAICSCEGCSPPTALQAAVTALAAPTICELDGPGCAVAAVAAAAAAAAASRSKSATMCCCAPMALESVSKMDVMLCAEDGPAPTTTCWGMSKMAKGSLVEVRASTPSKATVCLRATSTILLKSEVVVSSWPSSPMSATAFQSAEAGAEMHSV
jgi:hypothetical protein